MLWPLPLLLLLLLLLLWLGFFQGWHGLWQGLNLSRHLILNLAHFGLRSFLLLLLLIRKKRHFFSNLFILFWEKNMSGLPQAIPTYRNWCKNEIFQSKSPKKYYFFTFLFRSWRHRWKRFPKMLKNELEFFYSKSGRENIIICYFF